MHCVPRLATLLRAARPGVSPLIAAGGPARVPLGVMGRLALLSECHGRRHDGTDWTHAGHALLSSCGGSTRFDWIQKNAVDPDNAACGISFSGHCSADALGPGDSANTSQTGAHALGPEAGPHSGSYHHLKQNHQSPLRGAIAGCPMGAEEIGATLDGHTHGHFQKPTARITGQQVQGATHGERGGRPCQVRSHPSVGGTPLGRTTDQMKGPQSAPPRAWRQALNATRLRWERARP